MVKLFISDSGESDLPSVLCLHSLFLDHSMFDEFASRVEGRFRVIRPDFRGQGRSPKSVNTITMDDCADDIVDLMDDQGLTGAHVVAQSMGGDVALRVAARRPELVGRLVLLGSSAREEPEEVLATVPPLFADIEANGFTGAATFARISAVMFGETVRSDPDRADLIAPWFKSIRELPAGLLHAFRGVTERESVVGLLPQVGAKTLVVAGAEDHARPPSWSQEVVDHIPDAELVVLPTAGHSVILEQPDFVIAQTIEFLTA